MEKKILVVDDSAFMRKVLTDILRVAGFENVIEAENGKQALEKVESEKPDLVLLDIIMPEIDGIEVLKQLQGRTKSMIISAIGQDEIMKEAKQYGALGFIVKPFDNEKVIEEISKVIS
jgi:two-component system, chemotaxis family, chemotaxis protein CheY